jgi:hypothetical protein
MAPKPNQMQPAIIKNTPIRQYVKRETTGEGVLMRTRAHANEGQCNDKS